ncbi:hypothetical protein [Pseudalkalibacillus salsuginis]|uniref:hypothetical protein n=1 Tax=Pseudalkalibacillus salsuginis TaxID=2910972 RepID=UPI001F457AC0|nr:hypothetical protein [Pseudalkalibacillus salsuginis]MCF6411075.1 hypothetical protein [Pseudalkalibacillus salsuginis]
MRIQTLIVKGLIAGACLLVPSEVLANGKGKLHELPEPPEEANSQAEEQQNENAAINSKRDQQNGSSDQKSNRELPVQAKADKSEDKGNPAHANIDAKGKAVNGKGVSELRKETNKPDQDTEKTGTSVHSDRGKNETPLKDESSSFEPQMETEEQKTAKKKLDQKNDSKMDPIEHTKPKTTDNTQASRNNQQPLPYDENPADAPFVIPSQTGNQLSKPNKHNDGSSKTSGNGSLLYVLSFTGIGPLVTLDRGFLVEHRREHNQWINAPPSPPPKSNLLPHSA